MYIKKCTLSSQLDHLKQGIWLDIEKCLCVIIVCAQSKNLIENKSFKLAV